MLREGKGLALCGPSFSGRTLENDRMISPLLQRAWSCSVTLCEGSSVRVVHQEVWGVPFFHKLGVRPLGFLGGKGTFSGAEDISFMRPTAFFRPLSQESKISHLTTSAAISLRLVAFAISSLKSPYALNAKPAKWTHPHYSVFHSSPDGLGELRVLLHPRCPGVLQV